MYVDESNIVVLVGAAIVQDERTGRPQKTSSAPDIFRSYSLDIAAAIAESNSVRCVSGLMRGLQGRR